MTEQEKINSKRVGKRIAKRIVSSVFSRHLENLKLRSNIDQNIIGDLLTVIEMEIKDEIKMYK